MGIFDFFKRKNETSSNQFSTNKNTETSAVYKVVSKYNEYSKLFVNMMANGDYAPIAAYEKSTGEIIGYLYTTEDMSYTISAEEVITAMKKEFATRMDTGSIKSYAIFYHSTSSNDNQHAIADSYTQPTAISIILKNDQGFDVMVGIPYQYKDEGFSVGPMSDVTASEFQEVLNVPLLDDKDYFQERIVSNAKTVENEFGVTIKTVNTGSVGDLWRGIFGFEYFETMQPDFLYEFIELAQTENKPIHEVNTVSVHQLDFDWMNLRVICNNRHMLSAFPRIKTTTKIDVTLKQIDQREHIQDLEAIVHGGGRDTFAIRFYATDYAFTSGKYLSNTTLQMKLSGIIYVLDAHTEADDTLEDGTKFSPDFCMYMPGQEWAEFGCFDFIGKLESMKEVTVFNNEAHSGYILRIKLINNEEIEDFFTIDMFVNKKNMRITNLEVGMKLTGMFQLLGEIAD
ncbi:MAG: hypothetical protein AB8B65_07295 [Kordia sp.]|uniref:hypothetical protein n=1 Tax=Kordia sp. TaxID=1965332 RepID=UPI003859157B